VEDSDPRPHEFRGLACDNLKFLSDIEGKQLCITLLLDPKYKHEAQEQKWPSDFRIPGAAELSETIQYFKKSLEVEPENARQIEKETRDQRLSSAWFTACRYHLTL